MNTTLINLLLKIKNASNKQQVCLSIRYNKMCENFLKVFYYNGFIQSYKIIQNLPTDEKKILIHLRYFFNKPILQNFCLVSTPSKLKYLTFTDLSKIAEKKFVIFLSTNKGFLTSLECKKLHVGGKVLFVC